MTTTMDTVTTMPTEAVGDGRHILVAGLGNVLLMDDGVGVHAVQVLQQDAPCGVCVVEVGTAVLDALHLFEWADMILAIDAMQAGGAPGTVYRFGEGDIAEGGMPVSLHELSIKAALRLLPSPPEAEIVFIGVEPGTIHYGLELTPAVQAALPRVVAAAREIIARWRSAI
jgi:hydrogenase maturation protease